MSQNIRRGLHNQGLWIQAFSGILGENHKQHLVIITLSLVILIPNPFLGCKAAWARRA